jgi:hypothetical protein
VGSVFNSVTEAVPVVLSLNTTASLPAALLVLVITSTSRPDSRAIAGIEAAASRISAAPARYTFVLNCVFTVTFLQFQIEPS